MIHASTATQINPINPDPQPPSWPPHVAAVNHQLKPTPPPSRPRHTPRVDLVTAPISPRWWRAMNERERDVREAERTEDERMWVWVFCERKRERTAREWE